MLLWCQDEFTLIHTFSPGTSQARGQRGMNGVRARDPPPQSNNFSQTRRALVFSFPFQLSSRFVPVYSLS